MEQTIGTNALQLKVGDITEQHTDVIVNAANGTLLGGGGVDGAIHKKAGTRLLHECKEVREQQLGGAKLATGEVVLTKGYELPAHYVIHTVGPIWSAETDGQEVLLANCYRNALNLAKEHNVSSISFPSISTGIYRFPLDIAAKTALSTVVTFLEETAFGTVIFTLFSNRDYEVYSGILQEMMEDYQR